MLNYSVAELRVTIKSFYNVFNHCEDMKNQEMDDKVADFFAHR